MIDYIIKHQNSAVYSHLFTYNLVDLLQKKVPCTDLFESKLLNYNIEFVEWPSLHSDGSKQYAAYNKSMFKIRYEYANCFPELAAQGVATKSDPDNLSQASDQTRDSYSMDGDNANKKSGSEERRNKLTKIKYQLNLLCSMS